MCIRVPAVMVVYAISCPCLADSAAPAVTPVLDTFDYRGVVLHDGPLLREVLEVRENYLRVPNDDLLKGFRRRAGLAAPGIDLPGWYTADIFHVFGQVVSGLARMYAATGDPACRDKVDVLLSEWGRCIGPDGFFFYSRKTNAPHYVYEKMVCGLVDAHLYAGNVQAIELLGRITDWAEKHLDRTNQYGFNWGGGPTEWYTLSENLYRAYLASGDDRYRDFARVWEYTDYWDLYALGKDIFSRKDEYHAYSHLNALNGAAQAYRVSGTPRQLMTLVKAHDYFQQHQVFATGGYGPGEMLLPAERIIESLDVMDNHFETQCGSWAAFKMCKSLIGFTGDARFGDWIEKLAINGLGAGIPTSPVQEVYYYARYGAGGSAKGYTVTPWCCCAGSRIQVAADYHDVIYFMAGDDLHVNLYTPSSVSWQPRGTSVSLRQATRFPLEPRSRFVVSAGEPVEFTLRFRAPGWLAGPMTAVVNGEPVSARVDARHWLALARRWQDGDQVDIHLPMSFAAGRVPASSASPFPTAVTFGPTVLAFRSPQGNPSRHIDFAHVASNFLPLEGEPLQYRLRNDPSVLVRPFYMFKQDEPYFIYLDPRNPWVRLPTSSLSFSPGWAVGGEMRIGDMLANSTPGSFVECTFSGSAVRWIGRKYDNGGKAEVRLDGKVVAVVDQYTAAREVPFCMEWRDLPPGRHTLRVTVLEEANPASQGRSIVVMGFDAQD